MDTIHNQLDTQGVAFINPNLCDINDIQNYLGEGYHIELSEVAFLLVRDIEEFSYNPLALIEETYYLVFGETEVKVMDNSIITLNKEGFTNSYCDSDIFRATFTKYVPLYTILYN